jgi:excisionase family DNA binding protein
VTHGERAAYRVEEAARLLGVSARTVRRLIASKRLRATDNPTLISRAALYEFLGEDEPAHAEAATS